MANDKKVEYEIGLKDGLSNPLSKATGKAQSLDSAMGRVASSAQGASSVFAGMLQFNIFERLVSGAGEFITKYVTAGAQLEQTRISFQTLIGSVEGGNKTLRELTKFADVTPFDTAGVQKAGRTLLAFGVTAEELLPTLNVLGDVSAGTGKDLSELGVIYGQIKGAGRLMGQDLLQLINAGFNPLQQISKSTGKSMAELKSDMEKGAISFSMVQQAFIDATSEGGLFNNMMENQAKTLGGRWSTLMGNINSAIAQSSEKWTSFLGGLVNGLIDLVGWFTKNTLLISRFIDIIGYMAVAIGGITLALYPVTIATWLWNAALMANPIGLIIAGVAAFAAGLAYLYTKVESVRGVLFGLWEVVKQIGSNIANYFTNLFTPFFDAIAKVKSGDYLGAAKALGKGVLNLTPVGMVSALSDGVGEAFTSGFDKGVTNFKKEKLKGVFDYDTNDGNKSLQDFVTGDATGKGTGGAAGKGGKQSSTSVDGVSSGRPTHVTVNITKLIETFNAYAGGQQDLEIKIKNMVAGALVSAVNDVNLISQ